MSNLYVETYEIMTTKNKTTDDVAFIDSRDGQYGCTWAEYSTLANIDYNSGFGGQEIASDLVIVFRDGSWLERAEYDGSEWWDYCTTPDVPAAHEPIRHLSGECSWSTLSEIHAEAKATEPESDTE